MSPSAFTAVGGRAAEVVGVAGMAGHRIGSVTSAALTVVDMVDVVASSCFSGSGHSFCGPVDTGSSKPLSPPCSFINQPQAIAMGNYYFTSCADGSKTKVEYTFGYKKNADGKVGTSENGSASEQGPQKGTRRDSPKLES